MPDHAALARAPLCATKRLLARASHTGSCQLCIQNASFLFQLRKARVRPRRCREHTRAILDPRG